MNEQNLMNDLNLSAINDEYDLQISNLKTQLLFAKEERKKTENEFYLIKHRLTKLKNQEITNNLNFQNIKNRFKLILKNRLESNKKINDNYTKYQTKKLKNLSPIINNYFSISQKSNNINNNIYNKNKNGKRQNKTHNNFYSGLNNKILNEDNSYKYDINNKNDNNINGKQNENDSNEEEIEKSIIKKKILEKLKEDQEEKRRIEEEIAKIEEEELLLINEFNKIKQ